MVVSRTNGNISSANQIGGFTLVGGKRENRDLKHDYFRLKILHERILFQLRTPMINYSTGEFDNFETSMSNELIMSLTRVLNNENTFFMNNTKELKNYEYEGGLVDKYIYISNRLLDTVKQARTEYIKIRNLENENSELKSYKEILLNQDKLIAYLEEQRTTSNIFSAAATLNVQPELKLWYQVYMERHGPPGDGVFNSELLAEIIEELVASGEVSEDELIY
jgi:hypothetical protein